MARLDVNWRVREISQTPCSNCRRGVRRMSSEMSESKIQIIVAVIALFGVIGGALITNWDKLFPRHQAPAPKPRPGIEEKSPDHTPGRSNRSQSAKRNFI